MELDSLTSLTASLIKDLYGLDIIAQIDWHPALKRKGTWYQSDICERVSELVRLSPASMAYSLQEVLLKNSNFAVEIDNRGFIYIEASQIAASILNQNAKSVLLYIQPPASELIDLHYLKFLSQIYIQMELLRIENVECKLCLPKPDKGDSELLIVNADQFFGKQGALKLLTLLKDLQHQPRIVDISNITISESASVVLWLTVDILSLPGIAQGLRLLRDRLPGGAILNFRHVALLAASGESVEADFLASFDRYGMALIVYLAELEHALDLDWQTAELENWLNFEWLLDSLGKRLHIISKGLPALKAAKLSQEELELKFLFENLDYMQQRGAFLGDSIGFIGTLRKLSTSLHLMINKGYARLAEELNIPTSFPEKISSIIREF